MTFVSSSYWLPATLASPNANEQLLATAVCMLFYLLQIEACCELDEAVFCNGGGTCVDTTRGPECACDGCHEGEFCDTGEFPAAHQHFTIVS